MMFIKSPNSIFLQFTLKREEEKEKEDEEEQGAIGESPIGGMGDFPMAEGEGVGDDTDVEQAGFLMSDAQAPDVECVPESGISGFTRGVLSACDFGALLVELRKAGYRTLGPTVRDGVIVYDELVDVEELPAGWTDEQDGGTYRLTRRQDGALFGYAVGADSWKREFFPQEQKLWQADRTKDGGFTVQEEPVASEKRALIGVRSCELHAMEIQDRVFLRGPYQDPHYAAARKGLFVVAVNCSVAGGTCFCVSMGTGPGVTSGADLVLTELLGKDQHEILVEAGSVEGEQILGTLPVREASPDDKKAAKQVVERTRSRMGRTMDVAGLRELLRSNLEHPRWHEVAERCLTCANCTMVCPTCFCSTVEDVTDLTGEHAERWRKWDSCFTMDFSYVHGGSVRTSSQSRYRQWMTHKLGSWIDQFGTSGCVGCGRCITWCPVGIDITEEISAIRANPIRPTRKIVYEDT